MKYASVEQLRAGDQLHEVRPWVLLVTTDKVVDLADDEGELRVFYYEYVAQPAAIEGLDTELKIARTREALTALSGHAMQVEVHSGAKLIWEMCASEVFGGNVSMSAPLAMAALVRVDARWVPWFQHGGAGRLFYRDVPSGKVIVGNYVRLQKEERRCKVEVTRENWRGFIDVRRARRPVEPGVKLGNPDYFAATIKFSTRSDSSRKRKSLAPIVGASTNSRTFRFRE